MTFNSGFKDSIEYVAPNDSPRNQNKIKGKLIKGGRQTKTIPTIPSKYFTVINDNSDKKGFTNSSKRFQAEYDENPGPGKYLGQTDINEALKKTSDSKNGFGNLASKTKRNNLSYVINDKIPGAGTYDVSSPDSRRRDFSTGPSRIFQKPIVEPDYKRPDTLPAPNQYEIQKSNKILYKTNNTTANAAFKSQSKRNISQSQDVLLNPAPGTYNVNEKLLHNSTKVPYSSFKSKTKRAYNSYSSMEPTPGPADYKINEFDSKEVRNPLARKHYLAISAPAAPISPPLPVPGPGAYNVTPSIEQKKAYMSSAIFVSCTSRWTNDLQNENNPGPTAYMPRKPKKQSFLYNIERKWV